MTARDFGGSLDNHLTPDDPAHDYTENLSESEFKEWLLLWFDFANAAEQHSVRQYINARMAKGDSEMAA